LVLPTNVSLIYAITMCCMVLLDYMSSAWHSI
jgi:hypothetical protein